MVSRSRSVCTPVGLAILGSGTPARITASLAFYSDDPYAVHMTFHARDGQEDVEWMFSRQLLSVGLLMPAGDGDVRVWPGPESSGATYLQLRSPHGEAMFQAERGHFIDFLLRSYVVVPPGCESRYLDLDTELALLHDDLA